MKPYKVLHVVTISLSLPCFLGDQFDYFRKKGIEFHVACSPSTHLKQYAIKKKFKPFSVNISRKISPIQDLISLFQLIKYIKKNKIEIVIGHTPKGGLLGILAAYLSGVKKRVYCRHGIMYETSTGIKRQILKSIEAFTGFLATKVIADSSSVLEVSNENGLSHPTKNFILGKGSCNGIDVNRFTNLKNQSLTMDLSKKLNLEGNYVVGYVGRLVKDKGITELIDAWKILKKNKAHIKLLLVGPFEERDQLAPATIHFIRTEPSIVHVGLVSDTKTYYELMDLFILPSYREGFPTVVLEASAMSLPIVTTNATGCRDAIIPNQTGLFTTINADEIASKINYYIEHKDVGKIHGLNGRAFVIENFKQEYIWQEIEEKIFNE